MSIATPYAARIRAVEILERNKAQVTNLSIYRNNSLVIPTAGTYSLISPVGKKIVDAETADISGDGVVSYTHTTTELKSSLNLGEGYMQEWSVTIESVVHTFRRMVSLVLRRLYAVVSDIDLIAVYTDLEELRPSSITSYQKYIDDAWFQIMRKIRQRGSFEYLVLSSESLYEAHRHLALYLIFRDFHSSLGASSGRYYDLALEHMKMYDIEFKSINWLYDQNHDNKADDPDKRTAQQSVIYTNGRPFYRYNRYNRFGNY